MTKEEWASSDWAALGITLVAIIIGGWILYQFQAAQNAAAIQECGKPFMDCYALNIVQACQQKPIYKNCSIYRIEGCNFTNGDEGAICPL